MRRSAVLRIIVCCLLLPGLRIPAAEAQGLFQSLFGFGEPQRPLPPASYGWRAPLQAPYRQRERDRDGDERDHRSGRYRTLCVRLCDGYYWPVSNAVSRSRFYTDANLCRASCGEEARLFYHPASDADTNDMVDLQGRAYARLSTAYIYRKKQIDGCRCKPAPWAQSEIDRHRLYALAAEDELKRAQSRSMEPESRPEPPVVIAGNPPPAPARALPSPAADNGATVPGAGDPGAVPSEQPEAQPPAPRTAEAASSLRPEPKLRQGRREARETSAGRSARPQQPSSAARSPVGGVAPYGLGGATKRWPGD